MIRDYASEIRALIDAEFGDGDSAPLVAVRIVEKLRATDPELLAGWLDSQAVTLLIETIGYIDRSERTHNRAVASRSVFREASDSGEVSGFLGTRFVVDHNNTRISLGKMKAKDLEFVANGYRVTARTAGMEAAFFTAIKKKIGAGSVEDHFTNAQIDQLRRSIIKA